MKMWADTNKHTRSFKREFLGALKRSWRWGGTGRNPVNVGVKSTELDRRPLARATFLFKYKEITESDSFLKIVG